MTEVVCAFVSGDGVEGPTDAVCRRTDGALGDASDQRSEFGKGILDRVQTQRVRRQATELSAGFIENVTDAGDFMGGASHPSP